MIRKIQQWSRTINFKRGMFQFSLSKQYEQKFINKQYLEILGMPYHKQISKKKKIGELTFQDIHRAYLKKMKKYHSDNVHNQVYRKDYEEISKYISKAYDQLKQNKNISDKIESYEEEDEICMKLFGKKFVEMKILMYSPGNQKLKQQFLKEWMKKNQKSEPVKNVNRESLRMKPEPINSTADSGSTKIWGWYQYLYLWEQKKKQSSPIASKRYTDQQFDKIEAKTTFIQNEKGQKFINNQLQQRPAMLRYPQGIDPDIFTQLIQYSIASDIHLYEVSPDYFIDNAKNKQLRLSGSADNIDKYELTETKPNTLLSLSLEAERVFQNVYVKVEDVLNQIKTTGKFVPPKVLFRFHGFMLAEIRDKPFSLKNYRNTEYISVFDLYFDYYSPIFFKRDHFVHYLVGYNQVDFKNTRYFGYVSINNRDLPLRYLAQNEKVVLMRDVDDAYTKDKKYLKKYDKKYVQSWRNYYQEFEKQWKKYGKKVVDPEQW